MTTYKKHRKPDRSSVDIRTPILRCQDCGHEFREMKAVGRAPYYGCPRCGCIEIDLA